MQRSSHPSPSLSLDTSNSTAISPQFGSHSPPDANSGAKRRNSWNKSRESISEDIRPSFAMPPMMTTNDEPQVGRAPGPSSSSGLQYQPPYPPGQAPRPRNLSQNSLDSNASAALTEGEDRIHLTSAAAGFSNPHGRADENEAEQGRRRVQRPQGHYGERGRTFGTLKTMSRNIRRASMRVVNLAGVTLEDRPMRLEDESPDQSKRNATLPGQDEEMPELSRERLRGRTLGVFSPQSVIRRAMLSVLLWRWTEPIILLLIMFNAVVLTIQAHRSVFETGREDGFFKTWEDYALFVLFNIFTVEAFARILVTGLVLDPTTQWTDYRLFFQKVKATPGKVHSRFGTVPSGSTVNIIEAKLPSESGASAAGRQRSDSHAYPPGHSMERSSSWVATKLGLERHPFQLAIEKQQSLSEQNLPYLRHSWNRIDFVAVTSFWIMFGLAVTGSETSPTRHLYIFRALSVLRVARLLAVTSGTTTIMRSLKIAGPLLARVSVFVLFAMVLFSIVGVQSFKGSFRRYCQLTHLGFQNFEVAEEQKRARQFDAYLRKTEPSSTQVNWMEKWNPYRFVKAAPKSVAVETMPSGLVLPLKKAIVQDSRGRRQGSRASISQFPFGEQEKQKGVAGTLRRLFDLDKDVPDTVQLASLKAMRRESVAMQAQLEENAEHRLRGRDYLNANVPDPAIDETQEAMSEHVAQKADFIEAHPTYDKTFWVLSNQSPLRSLCQKLVTSAGGDRIFGIAPSPIAQPFFQFFVFLAVIGGIVVAAIATPAYRRQYYIDHGLQRNTWFDSADVAFACALILEFLVKIVADGFVFTPNAYLLSVWNVIDFLILIALLINMITTIVKAGGVSRATRSLKAFRALRLITFFPWMRDTFHSVLFAGAKSLVEAALLALLYMVPYAIWGLNIFSGLMFTCNDDSVAGKADCVGEYFSQPVDDVAIGFLAPRSWDRPSPSTTFSFDSFGSSLLILFEVVSFEGWIDVMGVAMDLVGKDLQPQLNNSQRNSLFFLIYDLLGAVIILTLFISIIIGNFSSRSGMALLTEDQKRWIDLQKLIKRQRPSKRPKTKPSSSWRAWCFDRAVQKNGWWSRGLTGLYFIHIFALATQTFTNSSTINQIRDFLFLVLTTIYAVDIAVRISGLGLRSFRANGWNIFDVFVVAGSFATTVPIVLGSKNFAVEQLQKLFLVCIAFKLVQKNSGLNQLFKTSVSSLPAILKLLLLWIVLFIFFAIVYVEVFGLTRWGSGETHTQNYRDFFNALIMLVFMSTGEGWNQYMHDFTVSYPACTNSGEEDPDSDCGSTGWAYSLFIAWNLLSMYIFVNMFTGVVVENFSYVFQLNNSRGSINRHEMRAFKKVWAMFDVEGTGFLTSASIVPFLSKLSGIFEVRTYPIEFSIGKIMEESQANLNEPRTVYSAPVISNRQKTNNIDIRALGDVISQIDQREISRRRATYIRLYHEAKITAESGKGISFTK
ncbi:hypothetical protein M407DRAFT_214388 [Tulasnella calospora MUT 4182]|uniref:Calcium-channel protein CCH1 n=1 Tax=Tulasnella calospora MUT 4182 TaxID=1051891 RepID=A0A0C3LER6_9AGAM|nr:hypothetical protein M407DRAFT_214388 [Tulasnella calospora MUT 4182]